ncbi:MAG: cupin domain-containing protein [Bacteroidales bacterium]|nr:cupin domain-containing protein [Bacteroidales bacterium]
METNTINLDSVDLFMEYDKTESIRVNDNVTRKFKYLNNVMTVIVDFDNGPMPEPDPPHSHLAEQITYVAEGEVLVIIGDKKQQLKAGDIFIVPSNVPHTVQSLTRKLRLIDSFNPIREEFIQK